jgi:hypothetical protein
VTDTQKAERLQASCAALLKKKTFYVSRRGHPPMWKVKTAQFECEAGSPDLLLELVRKQLKKGG